MQQHSREALEAQKSNSTAQDWTKKYKRGQLLIPTFINIQLLPDSSNEIQPSQEPVDHIIHSSHKIEDSVSSLRRSSKNGQGSYPTNNFLGISKCIHMTILREEMGEQAFKKDPFLQQMQRKPWLGRVDFVKLYSTQHLFPYLDKMFKTNRLYRQLHRSRARPETKKICFAKLYLFARAYATKTFARIN